MNQRSHTTILAAALLVLQILLSFLPSLLHGFIHEHHPAHEVHADLVFTQDSESGDCLLCDYLVHNSDLTRIYQLDHDMIELFSFIPASQDLFVPSIDSSCNSLRGPPATA